MAPNKRKVFYGWWIVAACFLILAIFSGVGMYGFGVFLKPLTTEFGWSRAAVGAMTTICFTILGITGPLAGRLTERYGPRKVMVGGALMISIGLVMLSMTQSLWYLYVAIAVLSLGMGGISLIPTSSAVASWFRGKRGTAMGIATAGIGFGALVLAPLQARLIFSLGWRQTYAIMAIVALAVVVLASLLMRSRPDGAETVLEGNSPSPKEPAPGAASSARKGIVPSPAGVIWTSREALKTWTFWLIVIAFSGSGLAAIGLLVHQVAFLNDRGVSMAMASTALGLTGGMGGLGKILFGYLSDKLSIRYMAALTFGLQGLGAIFLMQTSTAGLLWLWLYVVVFGLSMGGSVPLQALIVGEYFGLASFASILGAISVVVYIAEAAGPFLAGSIYDVSSSYYLVFLIFLAIYAISTAAVLFVRRPVPRPVRESRPPVSAKQIP